MSKHSRLPNRLLASVVSAVLLLTGIALLGPGSAAAASGRPAARSGVTAPVPTIDWQRCTWIHALCAKVPVPLDYDDPTGATITLDLVKVPALDPGARIGSIFVNPGGPGGSAVEFAPYGADLLGDSIALHYDVIGIDPRGVGQSARMSCRKKGRPAWPENDFPWRHGQVQAAWEYASFFRAACVERPNEMVAHMTTADTARDMDLIRQAMGDDLLNYYGISYGTYLGATYAAMFPDHVGRFVVDGVLDPVQWSTGDGSNADQPFSTRIDSASGATDALRSGLKECDRLGKAACPIAGKALRKWRKLVDRAQAGKLTLGGGRITYPTLVGFALGSLYDSVYDGLAWVLNDLWQENMKKGRQARLAPEVTAASMRAEARDVIRNPWSAPALGQYGDPFLGVACSDSDNPTSKWAWWRAGQAQDETSPWFGSLWTWASAPCGGWPSQTKDDRFTDFVPTTTETPILVVGNAHDPATPIHGARTVNELFTNSELLTLNGWGHGAIGNSCVTQAFDDYYSAGTLPAAGTVCQPDHDLYGSFELARTAGPWPTVSAHR